MITVIALYDFQPQGENSEAKISLKKGDKFRILKQDPSGWWHGINIDDPEHRGWFPASYTKIIAHETANNDIDVKSNNNTEDKNIRVFEKSPVPLNYSSKNIETINWQNLLEEGSHNSAKQKHDEKGHLNTILASSGVNSNSNSSSSDWEVARTVDGRLYYYNKVTNKSVWRFEDIGKKNFDNSDDSHIHADISDHESAKIDEYVLEVVKAISSLSDLIREEKKSHYFRSSRKIIQSIQNLFLYTNNANYELFPSESYGLIKAASIFVLCIKTASGIWPPPDANLKVRDAAGKILRSVKAYVLAAKAAGQNLEVLNRESKSDIARQDSHDLEENDPIAKIDGYSANIKRIMDYLLDFISKTAYITNDCPESSNHAQAAAQWRIINNITEMTAVVNELISFLDEQQLQAQIESIAASAEENSNIYSVNSISSGLKQYKDSFQNLKDQLSSIIGAATLAREPFAPVNATRNLLVEMSKLLRKLKELITLFKKLWAGKDILEQEKFYAKIQNLVIEENQIPREQFSEESQSNVVVYPTSDKIEKDPEQIVSNALQLNSSLRNIMGEELLPKTRRKTAITSNRNNTWYLSDDHAPDDIVLTDELPPKVKRGTVNALIVRLTSHEYYDHEYVTAFLYTFRLFIDPEELIDRLIDRFNITSPSGLSETQTNDWNERKRTPVRLRVLITVKRWIEDFWYHDIDKKVLSKIKRFAKETIEKFLPRESEKIIDLCSKREKMDPALSFRISIANTMSVISQNTDVCSIPIFPKIRLSSVGSTAVTEIDPSELARQLTILETTMFLKINPIEFLFYKSDEKRQSSVNSIRQMITGSNQITGWVAETILLEKDLKKRVLLLRYFIKVAENCENLKNYATRQSITAALQSTPIYRLKKTWENVPAKTKLQFDALLKLMDRENNFMTYRQTLKKTIPPCVPFLGLYLTDIIFIKQGNNDRIAGSDLLNFDKFSKLASVVDEINRLQSAKYNFTEIEELLEDLERFLGNSRDIQELHDMSHLIEPREKSNVRSDSFEQMQEHEQILKSFISNTLY